MARRPFLQEQITALAPLDFVAFIAPRPDGIGYVEVHRLEAADTFRLEIGAEPPLAAAELATVARLGLVADPDSTDEAGNPIFVVELAGGADVAARADRALAELFACPDGAALDVRHGSGRLEAEAARRLAALRDRLTAALPGLVDDASVGTDPDDDLTCSLRGCRLVVCPRVIDEGPALVRVMTVTNLEVEPSPALGLFVAQTNFELEVGRLAYDGQDRVVWFELDLVGEAFTDEDLAFALRFVAEGAGELDERIMHLFGGTVLDVDTDTGLRPGPKAKGGTSRSGTGGYL